MIIIKNHRTLRLFPPAYFSFYLPFVFFWRDETQPTTRALSWPTRHPLRLIGPSNSRFKRPRTILQSRSGMHHARNRALTMRLNYLLVISLVEQTRRISNRLRKSERFVLFEGLREIQFYQVTDIFYTIFEVAKLGLTINHHRVQIEKIMPATSSDPCSKT